MSPFPPAVIALALALAGCITPPEFDSQQRTIANEHLCLSSRMVVPIPVQSWWGTFKDPQLDHFKQLALADNPSLVPCVSFNAKETRQRFSGHDVIPPLIRKIHSQG